MKMIKPIVNIAKIASDYDTFIFGYNGVLTQNGVISEQVGECLRNLHELGKNIIIISNSSLRIAEIVEQFENSGINPEIFSNIVTAGEILHYLLKYPEGDFAAVGENYYQIGKNDYSGVMSGLAKNRVTSIEKAHFLYMAEGKSCEDVIDDYRNDLEQAVNYGLPFVCAGNDTACFMDGKLALASGAIGEAYAVLGGRVITLGKPDVKILEYALERMANKGRVVVIGDNVATDIKMATLAGVASIIVSKGRHVNYLGEGYIPDVAKTRELVNSFDVAPEGVISEVRW